MTSLMVVSGLSIKKRLYGSVQDGKDVSSLRKISNKYKFTSFTLTSVFLTF